MTTPERLKRRQLIEGAALIAIGVLMILQSWYFNAVDRDQRKCLADNFQDLSVALDVRADITDRETSQNKALWGLYAEAAGIIKESGKPVGEALTERQKAQLNERLVDQLLEYQREMDDIERDRRRNPLPPYPVGACEG